MYKDLKVNNILFLMLQQGSLEMFKYLTLIKNCDDILDKTVDELDNSTREYLLKFLAI